MNSVLKPYIDVEVERLTNNVVDMAVNEVMDETDINNIITIDDNVKISYNTSKLNKIKKDITEKIQSKIINLDDGIVDEYLVPSRIKKSRFKKVKNGILCDISVASIRGSTLLANVGPTIPIRLFFNSQVNSSIDVEVKEYGINNVIVKVYYIINIKDQITMPLSSKRKTIHIKTPIAIDIIEGKIPNYYTGYIK